jgi:gluconate 5-dehydrogenase
MNIKNLFDLKGKVSIVTGGGRGIGKFMATGLAEAGSNVVIASRKLDNCEKEVQELEKLGVKALAVKCDMAKKDDIDNLVKTTMDKFGTIDILVNNAGLTWGAPTLDFPLDKWEKIFDVNIKGVWILSQQVARIMKEKGGGKMINVSSIYGSRGSNEEEHPAVAYNPSKFAVEGLTKTLAIKLARYKINETDPRPDLGRHSAQDVRRRGRDQRSGRFSGLQGLRLHDGRYHPDRRRIVRTVKTKEVRN